MFGAKLSFPGVITTFKSGVQWCQLGFPVGYLGHAHSVHTAGEVTAGQCGGCRCGLHLQPLDKARL